MSRQTAGRKLFEVALVSDTHVNEREDFSASPYPANAEANPRARHVFAQIAQSDAAFAVHMGDMINPVPELPSYAQAAENFHSIAGALSIPLHLVPGNHDIGDKPVDWMPAGMVNAQNIAIYEQHFGKHFYSFDHADVHFVVLNASLINSGDPAEATQKSWLEKDLQSSQGQRTFFFIHYPLYVSDPAEPTSYDNIDEPGRSWLLGLIERHKPEALFSAHVHNFWYDMYGETAMYVMPSTCFVRHDYSEMYRIDGGDQFGRNDAAKLGFVTLEIYETGHVTHYHRTYGRCLAEDALDEPASYPRTHVKRTTLPRVSVDMRHSWAEEMTVAPSGAVDEFRRKTARNDYPVMALWEMGLSGMRVPVQDLLDDKVRRRMTLLRPLGHRFHVYMYDLPDSATAQALTDHADLIDRLEVVISWDQRKSLLPAILALKEATGVPLLLSRVNRKDAAKTSGGRYNHLISHGFSLDEMDELADFAVAQGAAIDGFVFSISREVDPHPAITRLDEFGERTGKLPVLYVKSTTGSPWADFCDDRANALRIGEAVMAATGATHTHVVLDTFADADRGYFVRTGLVDRRFNPRLAGRMLTALAPRLAGGNWKTGSAHSLHAEDGTTLMLGVATELCGKAHTQPTNAIWHDPDTRKSGPISTLGAQHPEALLLVETSG
ncbi:metallophosphoesterase family protein [Roseovarius pelagicus]|uniref:Metallophosphoesterase n=1 Tax=Roseovarius pelagicus TaxID=2980108 RepID=A0ABY6DF47_9RHOB|nr:metallophosphoesterase [Roseovarius pelagicus]UXX84776.1 metallophosphoesterase [Roseovarius pelagicus]